MPFKSKVLYWLDVSGVKVRYKGSCESDLVGKERAEQEEDPCQDLQSAITSQNGTGKPLFCASDGISYFSSTKYACAVKANGDWFHCEYAELWYICSTHETALHITENSVTLLSFFHILSGPHHDSSGQSLFCHHGGPGSRPVQSMWDLLLTEWHWDRIFSDFFSFPLPVLFHRRYSHSYIARGMNNTFLRGSSSET
jgi:hypothetical protein